jgi:hypothetical protein
MQVLRKRKVSDTSTFSKSKIDKQVKTEEKKIELPFSNANTEFNEQTQTN